ncbi:hypothetical protein VC83_07649 [Pseudogymnoascus destructans]|uniref:Uncharacterized protein n=2 Tax=Pseudogymnoascus destructans TaxID=655981 RepID=L8FXS7_PSED2|nr:uncharacterized protein VC83_07649 [Pseudogymnoascus destructans]ELR05627.1 hypothetical protein GMDG_01817 [Pseudogymnoascus destructans 20631-21]OAF55567.1 hypothetical protein VC83_07649 [Pseudogymnoascus destructans]
MESSQLRVFPGTSHPASKTIPLDKYSSAVSREGSKSHRWVHDVRKDLLTLTFKPVDIPIDGGRIETHLFLAVTAGRDTLEHLDVQKLVKWSQEHNERVRRVLIGSGVESPVQVIVRFPCVAMRFPGAPSMVHRFQLRFKDDKQYFEALNILKRAGLQIKESTNEPKQDTPSQDRNVAYNRSLAPTSTQPPLAGHPDNHQKPQFAVPSSESSRRFTQFTNSSSIPPRSDTSSSLSMRPSSTFSADLGGPRSSSSLGTLYKYGVASDDFCFQPPPPRPFSSTSFMRSSPPIYASQIETQQRATLSSLPCTKPPSDMVESRKKQAYIGESSIPLSSDEAPRTGYDALEKSPELPDIRQLLRGSTESLTTQPTLNVSKMRRSATTQFEPSQSMGYNNEHLQLKRQSPLSFSTTRPMSVPTVGDDLHTSQWIPPKRELPFPKRKEPKNALETAEKLNKGTEDGPIPPSKGIGASESLANARTLPSKYGEQQAKRATVRRTNTPPTSKLSTVLEVPDSDETRPTNSPRNSVLWEEEPSPLASKSAAIARPSTAPGLKLKAMTCRKRPNEEAPKWALAKRLKMVDSSTQTQTLSGRDHTAAVSRTSTIVPGPVLPAPVTVPEPVLPAPVTVPVPNPAVPVPDPAPTPPPPEVVSEAKGPIEGFLDELGRFVPKHSGKIKPVELYEVSFWDKATEGERQSMTESWICEQIDDPAFIEMCKHVNEVWKKIGFKT